MDLEALVHELAGSGELVHVEHLAARPPRFGTLARPLPPELADSLPGALWSHQARAVDRARDGHAVVVATGTASGKTLCYQLPVAEAVLGPTAATALCIHPTKALAQDQLRSWGVRAFPGVVAATYDGDLDPETRTWVRRHANVLLTNPDMLHAGILPNHPRWSGFLGALRYVVVDELHVLRGVFGTHVAHVLRRLRRLCARYGSDPTFVFSSATIGAPARLASDLCGRTVEAIDDDGSPRAARLFALWNPPLTDAGAGTRRSPNVDSALITSALVRDGHRCITFTQSRRSAEVVAAAVQRALPAELAREVRPYRGGYLPSERREIEADLFSGRLRAVIATNALELGIDVGSLDAAVLDTFPGTIASTWQRAGRAGRAQGDSLICLVAGADQLDQWLMAHPKELFARPPEPAVVNLANPFILRPHVACAAAELPLEPDECGELWGDAADDAVHELVLADELVLRNGRAVWAGGANPATRVGLRTGSSDEFEIVDDDGRLVGTVDRARAFSQVHPGAIYLHQGQSFRVVDLVLDDRVAWVEPTDAPEITQPRREVSIEVEGVDRRTAVGRAGLSLGWVRVTHRVSGYRRRDIVTGETIEQVELDLPPTTLLTRAFWYEVPPAVVAAAGIDPRRLPGTLHAAEHAGIGILPLFTICDRWDVGGVSTAVHPTSGEPSFFVYDAYPGGAGIAELGFEAGSRHLATTVDVIEACSCAAGCPSCVHSPKCGSFNEPLDKAGAVALLRAVLAR